MKIKVKNVGTTAWRGGDFDGTALAIEPGEVLEMSPERAGMLVHDYPGRFELARPEPPAITENPRAIRRRKGRR